MSKKIGKYFLVYITIIFLSMVVAAQKSNEKKEDFPAVVKAVAPKYPTIAAATRIEGEVVVEIKIAPDGTVTNTTIISGHKRLTDVSESAAKQWKFESIKDDKRERITQLTFVYSSDYSKNQKNSEFSVIFSPPSRVEVIFIPGITKSTKITE